MFPRPRDPRAAAYPSPDNSNWHPEVRASSLFPPKGLGTGLPGWSYGGMPKPPPAPKPAQKPEESASKTPVKPGDQSTQKPVEIGGPEGPEPTRYGDWERNGRCTDF
jgi:hypothetical protein